MATVRIDTTACTACGTCVELCPVDVLRLDPERGVSTALYPDDCIWCFRCELECPAACIRVAPKGRTERPPAF